MSLSMNGLTSSMVAGSGMRWNPTSPMPISAAIWRSWQRLPLSHTRQESGWLASMRPTMVLRRSCTLGESVLITMPAAMGATQEASSAPDRSSSTRQMRQAPTGVRYGSWHNVGMLTFDSRASSRMVIPGRPLTSRPLSVIVIVSNHQPSQVGIGGYTLALRLSIAGPGFLRRVS